MLPSLRRALDACSAGLGFVLPAQAGPAEGSNQILDYAAALVTAVLVLFIICAPSRRD